MGILVWSQPVLAEIDDNKIANSCQPLKAPLHCDKRGNLRRA
jgi:hypothetical protein